MHTAECPAGIVPCTHAVESLECRQVVLRCPCAAELGCRWGFSWLWKHCRRCESRAGAWEGAHALGLAQAPCFCSPCMTLHLVLGPPQSSLTSTSCVAIPPFLQSFLCGLHGMMSLLEVSLSASLPLPYSSAPKHDLLPLFWSWSQRLSTTEHLSSWALGAGRTETMPCLPAECRWPSKVFLTLKVL